MAGGEALPALAAIVADACRDENEWAAGVTAGVCAGVDFAIADPEAAELDPGTLESAGEFARRYEHLIAIFTGFLQEGSPPRERRPASTDEALIAGVVGIVGDHLRLRRLDRLAQLRPELVLVVLLPYVGFDQARLWANRSEAVD